MFILFKSHQLGLRVSSTERHQYIATGSITILFALDSYQFLFNLNVFIFATRQQLSCVDSVYFAFDLVCIVSF